MMWRIPAHLRTDTGEAVPFSLAVLLSEISGLSRKRRPRRHDNTVNRRGIRGAEKANLAEAHRPTPASPKLPF